MKPEEKDCLHHTWEFELYLKSDVKQLKEFKQSNGQICVPERTLALVRRTDWSRPLLEAERPLSY